MDAGRVPRTCTLAAPSGTSKKEELPRLETGRATGVIHKQRTSKRRHWSALGIRNGYGFHMLDTNFSSVKLMEVCKTRPRQTDGQQSDNSLLGFRHAEMKPALTAALKQAPEFTKSR